MPVIEIEGNAVRCDSWQHKRHRGADQLRL